jgi:hypothetical protein
MNHPVKNLNVYIFFVHFDSSRLIITKKRAFVRTRFLYSGGEDRIRTCD